MISDIVLTNVSKFFKTVKAVDDVSFTAPTGELLVLLGPSGCGKSTVLRLIAGLEDTTSGKVIIGDRDVTHLPPAQRKVSMVFQSYALFPHLSVAENIIFGLKVRKVAKAERQERLHKVADILGLSELLHRRPAQLSGGQRQRVALGRAIIAETAVCLMDEPLSNLDAQLRHDMRIEIRSLQQRLGMTMIYVTHDQTEAMSMADQVILLVNGRIEQSGPPDQLYNYPTSIFAARFIGTPPMNILKPNGGMPKNLMKGLEKLAGGKGKLGNTLLGVRPEDIKLVGRGGLNVLVGGVEYFGVDTIVTCNWEGQILSLRLDGKSQFAAGEKIQITWALEKTHLFDAVTEKRLGKTGSKSV